MLSHVCRIMFGNLALMRISYTGSSVKPSLLGRMNCRSHSKGVCWS